MRTDYGRRSRGHWADASGCIQRHLDGSLPPAVGGDTVADVLADLPVEVDERRVNCGVGPRRAAVIKPRTTSKSDCDGMDAIGASGFDRLGCDLGMPCYA